MMKLELKHLAPYLPYGLKMQAKNTNLEYSTMTLCDKTGLSNIGISDVMDDIECFKPILRPLNDLRQENFKRLYDNMSWSTKVYIIRSEDLNYNWSESIPYFDFVKLLKNHFDVFNLIPNNLAIDINTLEL